MRDKVRALTRWTETRLSLKGNGAAAIGALIVAGVVAAAISGNPYLAHIAILTCLSVILSVTVRPLLLAGEASFCHGSFYALGAYTVGVLVVDYGFSVWVATPLGGTVAALGAVAIGVPSLRATGAYFILMTFAFLIVVNSLFSYLEPVTGGFSGISGIPRPAGITGIGGFLFLTLGFAVLTLGIFWSFERSRWGLELRALGDSRGLAQASGASRLGNMLAAFVVGAFFAGVAGGIYASYLTFISPASFGLYLSIYVIAYVILGGARYFVGPVVGAVFLGLLPLVLDWSEAYIEFFTAGVILLVLLGAPRGVVTEAVRLAGKLQRRRLKSIGVQATVHPREARDSELAGRRLSAEQLAKRDKVVSVRNATKQFDGLLALDNVSFDVREGETLGVIGPNGAGKTTLFNVISGFDQPTAGSVCLAGHELVGLPPHRIARLGLTRTFQASSVCETLTPYENILLACRRSNSGPIRHALVPVRGDEDATAQAARLVELFDIGYWGGVSSGEMPYGAGKRLGVAMALATQPRVLCLDEPMAGLTGAEAQQMSDILNSVLRTHNVTIVLIEHRVQVIRALCDRVLALTSGRIVAQGMPDEVIEHPAVVEAYLGSSKVTATDA